MGLFSFVLYLYIITLLKLRRSVRGLHFTSRCARILEITTNVPLISNRKTLTAVSGTPRVRNYLHNFVTPRQVTTCNAIRGLGRNLE
jgi:hypothetical protein